MSESAPLLKPQGDFGKARIAIAASLWNRDLVDQMLEEGERALLTYGVVADNIRVARVPGAFELPFAARGLLARDEADAVIAYGVIIRGETPHFDFIARACADGLMRAGLDSGRPAIFGVLTVDDRKQAEARGKDKGADAALTALEMLRHRF